MLPRNLTGHVPLDLSHLSSHRKDDASIRILANTRLNSLTDREHLSILRGARHVAPTRDTIATLDIQRKGYFQESTCDTECRVKSEVRSRASHPISVSRGSE